MTFPADQDVPLSDFIASDDNANEEANDVRSSAFVKHSLFIS